jgi:hypothetical protein
MRDSHFEIATVGGTQTVTVKRQIPENAPGLLLLFAILSQGRIICKYYFLWSDLSYPLAVLLAHVSPVLIWSPLKASNLMCKVE